MKILNRDVIKYIAIVFMFIDHYISIFMENGTFLYNLLSGLSTFTFITMSFFLVEGFQYTGSKIKYVKRIFLFGLISQLPYALATSKEQVLDIVALNVFFTLGFCFLMIWALSRTNNMLLKIFIMIVSIIICSFCDWMYFAPLFTAGFHLAKGNKKKIALAYIFALLLFGASSTSGYWFNGDFSRAFTELLVNSSGIILSGICTIFLYNGKCMRSGKKFNKWFFYWFYPAHLLVLGLGRIV